MDSGLRSNPYPGVMCQDLTQFVASRNINKPVMQQIVLYPPKRAQTRCTFPLSSRPL